MLRLAFTCLCLITAAPAIAADQALVLGTHADTETTGSFSSPINYRPRNVSDNATKNFRNGVISEDEILRSDAFNEADSKYLRGARTGAGSTAAEQPVVEIFVEHLPYQN